jgi:hypothetical protein
MHFASLIKSHWLNREGDCTVCDAWQMQPTRATLQVMSDVEVALEYAPATWNHSNGIRAFRSR